MTEKQITIIAPSWAWEDSINTMIDMIARRQALRAVDMIEHGKPGQTEYVSIRRGAGCAKYHRWTGRGHKVSKASELEAIEAARYALTVQIMRVRRKLGHWPVSLPVSWRRVAGLVAWRAAFKSLTRLDGGLTGDKQGAVFCDPVDNADLLRRLSAVSACFLDDPNGKRNQSKHASRVGQAKASLWFRLLGPWLDDSGRIAKASLPANARRSRAAAMRQYKSLCQLLDGHGIGSDTVGICRLLKAAGLNDGKGRGRRKGQTLSAQLANMPG